MEKLKFTLRFAALLALLPAVMYAYLSREERPKEELKKTPAEKVSFSSKQEMLCSHSPFMQAVIN